MSLFNGQSSYKTHCQSQAPFASKLLEKSQRFTYFFLCAVDVYKMLLIKDMDNTTVSMLLVLFDLVCL